MAFEYPHAVRVRGRSVIVVQEPRGIHGAPEQGTNYWLSPTQAEEYADRLRQAAAQARMGVVPELDEQPDPSDAAQVVSGASRDSDQTKET